MSDSKQDRGFRLVGEPKGDVAGTPAEPMSFGTFVLSLTTSALHHLGIPLGKELGIPELQEARVNLEMGRQTIEMLEMLRTKTRGNLDTDEARLLDQAIHDLQMRYIEVKHQLSS
jgi:hypothetical protein